MATAVAKHLHPVEMLERMTAREVLDLEDPEGILRSLESVMDDHYQPAKLRDKAREWVDGLRILVGTRAEFLEGVRHVTDRDLRDDDMLTWFTQGDMKDLENAALSAPPDQDAGQGGTSRHHGLLRRVRELRDPRHHPSEARLPLAHAHVALPLPSSQLAGIRRSLSSQTT